MPEIFLSYAHEDLDRIYPIVTALEEQGWNVFWDRRIPAGKTWRNYIGKALDESRCVIVVWSEKSVHSRWVIEEADKAQKHGKLVPLRLDEVEPPPGFGEIQAANLTDWKPGQASLSFKYFLEDVGSFLRAPSSVRSSSAAPAPPVSRPVPAAPARATRKPANLAVLAAGAGALLVIGVLSGWLWGDKLWPGNGAWWKKGEIQRPVDLKPAEPLSTQPEKPVQEARPTANIAPAPPVNPPALTPPMPAPPVSISPPRVFPRQWRVEWRGSRTKAVYSGSLALTRKIDDHRYAGVLKIRTPQGQEVYQDAAVSINQSRIEIRCSNPSLATYPADHFFLDLAGKTMTGIDRDVQGNIGYGVTFTAETD